MSKRLLLQLTVYDEETGRVEEQEIQEYGGGLGYEVTRMFDQLGERYATKMDPYHENWKKP